MLQKSKGKRLSELDKLEQATAHTENSLWIARERKQKQNLGRRTSGRGVTEQRKIIETNSIEQLDGVTDEQRLNIIQAKEANPSRYSYEKGRSLAVSLGPSSSAIGSTNSKLFLVCHPIAARSEVRNTLDPDVKTNKKMKAVTNYPRGY